MSVAGKWNVTMNTPMGTQRFEWNLQETGGGWQGTMQAPTGTSDLKNIKVNADALSFDTRVKSPMGSLDLTFNGAVNGSQMNGDCKTMFGDVQFTAVRG